MYPIYIQDQETKSLLLLDSTISCSFLGYAILGVRVVEWNVLLSFYLIELMLFAYGVWELWVVVGMQMLT